MREYREGIDNVITCIKTNNRREGIVLDDIAGIARHPQPLYRVTQAICNGYQFRFSISQTKTRNSSPTPSKIQDFRRIDSVQLTDSANVPVETKCLLQIVLTRSAGKSYLHIVWRQSWNWYSVVFQSICRLKLQLVPNPISDRWHRPPKRAENLGSEKKTKMAATAPNATQCLKSLWR